MMLLSMGMVPSQACLMSSGAEPFGPTSAYPFARVNYCASRLSRPGGIQLQLTTQKSVMAVTRLSPGQVLSGAPRGGCCAACSSGC